MIKAIPTRYKGYHFRSRLEARWAVFFDALNLDWRYEYQGYETPHGAYLPDFTIFSHNEIEIQNCGDFFFVEVKGALPNAPSDNDTRRWHHVTGETGAIMIVLAGNMSMTESWQDDHIYTVFSGFKTRQPACILDCPYCDTLVFTGLCRHCGALARLSPRIIEAGDLARSARFEFGASGGTLAD